MLKGTSFSIGRDEGTQKATTSDSNTFRRSLERPTFEADGSGYTGYREDQEWAKKPPALAVGESSVADAMASEQAAMGWQPDCKYYDLIMYAIAECRAIATGGWLRPSPPRPNCVSKRPTDLADQPWGAVMFSVTDPDGFEWQLIEMKKPC